jgi:hypothetical protein
MALAILICTTRKKTHHIRGLRRASWDRAARRFSWISRCKVAVVGAIIALVAVIALGSALGSF